MRYTLWPVVSRPVALALIVLVLMLAVIVHRTDAATVSGIVTHATKYEDGQDLGANLKHTRLDVGTCTATGTFGTKEGEAIVVPPATSWSVTVARQFGDFCARAQTETVSGLTSVLTASAKVTKVEPRPNPPVLGVVQVAAYEVLPHPIEGTRLGRNVGTVPLGTACGELVVLASSGEYFEVPRETVAFTRVPKSAVVVARCEFTS